MTDTTAQCPICGGTAFTDFRGRKLERCDGCGSLARHRIAFTLYRKFGLLNGSGKRRGLHLAPERHLHKFLAAEPELAYITADAVPEDFPFAECIRLFLPDGLNIFPNEYFDFIVHNHVMEHIPGSFRDHFPGMARILKVGGRLIFSVPGPNMSIDTKEGGEHLTKEERLARFGQSDHVRRFGRDLPEFLSSLPGGSFSFDDLTENERTSLSVFVGNRFMIWEKRDVWPVKWQAELPELVAAGAGRALERAERAESRAAKKLRSSLPNTTIPVER